MMDLPVLYGYDARDDEDQQRFAIGISTRARSMVARLRAEVGGIQGWSTDGTALFRSTRYELQEIPIPKRYVTSVRIV
jgi:hypothetical protein